MRRSLLAIVLLCLPLGAVAEEFARWHIPWEKTRPRDPIVDEAGIVWFAGQGGHYVGRLDPDTGDIDRFELPENTGPHNVIGDANGDLWVAGNLVGWIGRMDKRTGELQQFDTSAHGVKDPHTLIQDSEGRVWFTAQHANKVGVLDPENGEIRTWDVPTPRARPYGIVLNGEDQPWIVLLGTHKLATIKDGEFIEYDIPREGARPRRLDVIDGKVWYVDYAEGYYGRFDPETQKFQEWRSPSGEKAMPYGAIADDEGRFWFVETGPQPNRMIGVNAEDGRVIYNKPIPDSGGAVRHMFHDVERGAIWFGMDTNYIARFDLPNGE